MHAIFTTALLTGVFGLVMGSSNRQPSSWRGINMTPAAVAAAAPAARVATAADSLRAESALGAMLVRPQLEVYFARFNGDRTLVRRISRAVVREVRLGEGDA